MSKTPKEDFYDREISPLMKEIINKCKQEKINFFGSFQLDYSEGEGSCLMATTCLPVEEGNESQWLGRCVDAVRYKPVQSIAITTENKWPEGTLDDN